MKTGPRYLAYKDTTQVLNTNNNQRERISIMNNETVNTNVRNNSTANFEFTIGEVEFKGITLKNLKMSACADITDENMRISTDGAVGLFKALMSFADTKIDRLIDHLVESDNKRIEIRKLEAKESEARASKYDAESKYWDAKRDAILKEHPATADKDNE